MLISIWLTAAVFYLAFLYWYINSAEQISAEETVGFIEQFSASSAA